MGREENPSNDGLIRTRMRTRTHTGETVRVQAWLAGYKEAHRWSGGLLRHICPMSHRTHPYQCPVWPSRYLAWARRRGGGLEIPKHSRVEHTKPSGQPCGVDGAVKQMCTEDINIMRMATKQIVSHHHIKGCRPTC